MAGEVLIDGPRESASLFHCIVWVHDSTGDDRSEHGGSGTWYGAFLCKMDKGSRHNYSSLPLSGRPARSPDKRYTICISIIDRYIHSSTRAVGKKSPICG